MTKKYRNKEIEYEKKGQFDRDLNEEHRTADARDIGGGYRYLTKTPGERLRRFFLIPAVRVFGTIYTFFAYGFRVKGRKNLRAVKGGAVSVCNHVHEMDTLMVKLALGGFRSYHTGSFYLLKRGWAGRIFKAGGFLPVGTTVKDLENLQTTVGSLLQRGKIVNFYPEHALWYRYEKVRPFKIGAFRFAVKFGVPVLPMFIEFRQTRLRRLFRMQKKVILHILPAVQPEEGGSLKAKAQALSDRVRAAMVQKYEEVYQKKMIFLTEASAEEEKAERDAGHTREEKRERAAASKPRAAQEQTPSAPAADEAEEQTEGAEAAATA